jgi:hypothetical protein
MRRTKDGAPESKLGQTMRSTPRKLIRILMLVLIFATAFLFIYPMKNGKPLLSLGALHLPSIPEVPLPEIPSLGQGKGDAPVTVYQWQDSNGGWHFSNEAPPAGVRYEARTVDPNTNLLQSEGATASAPPEQRHSSPSTDQTLDFDYSPESISRVLEQTDKVREAAEQRQRQQQEIIEAE